MAKARNFAISRPDIDQLIAEHGKRVMNLLRGLLSGIAEAEDVWQETWFAVWRNRRSLRSDASPWGYVRKTAVRKALDRKRQTQRRIRIESLSGEPQAPESLGETSPIDLEALPLQDRAVLILRFWEGLALQEIADLVDLPLGTVKSQLHRARGRLKEQLRLSERKETCHDL